MGLAAEDHSECPSCQLKTGNKDYTLQKFAKFGQQKTGKVLPCMMSLSFTIKWAEFDVNNMKA